MYFKLIDRLNYGMIVRVEGRQQYTYVFGESVWKKTAILTLYFMDKTGFYDKYEEITEEQAYETMKQTEELYHRLERICWDKLKKLNGLIPELRSKNREIRIIYLLYCINKIETIEIDELEKHQFTPRMLRALKVLIDNGDLNSDSQMENILNNTLAMLAKSEDILQNGQNNERETLIIHKKIKHDNLVRDKS